MNNTVNFSGEIYTHADFENNYPGGMDRHYWTLARNRILATNIRRYLPDAGVILDVGCGRGFTVKFLSARGYCCYGVERGPVRVVPEAQDLVYAETRLDELPVDLASRVDTLLFLDVLEHVAEPVALIDEARETFPNARSILITVPARQELWSNYDEAFGHYLRYAYRDIERLMESARIQPLRLRYFFHSLYVPIRLLNMLNRPRAISFSRPGRTALHSLIATAFQFEAAILPGRVPGSSLLGVGRL